MGLIAAGVAGAVIGGVATAYAANESADAQKKSAAEARQTQLDTNALNYQMFREARGEGGNAILPLYADKTEGAILFPDALSVYDATGGLTPADYQRAIDELAPASRAATATANGIFNGDLRREQLGYLQPVEEARVNQAEAKKQSGLEALQQTLNEIDAIQAKKGFSGDSSGNRMLRFNARRQILGQAAQDVSQANLENATDERAIGEQDINRRLQNIGLPGSMAKAKIDLLNLPGQAAIDRSISRQQLFNMFRLSPQSFRADTPPTPPPVAGTGQIVAQGVGQLAGSLGNLAVNRYLAGQTNQAPTTYNFYNGAYSGGLGSAAGTPGVYTGDINTTMAAGYV